MNRHRIDRATAERLLRGESASAPHVAEVLAAASAPAGPDELAGEAAAVAAFREARVEAAAAAQRRLGRRGLLRPRTAALVAAAVVAGALGLAVGNGAVSGRLPGGLVGGSGGAPDTQAPGTSAITPRPSTPRPTATADKTTPRGGPSPSLEGLCRSYRSKPGSPGKTLDSPAFASLIRAAGGKEQVPRFCAKMLDGKEHGRKGKDDNGRGGPAERGDKGGKDGEPGGGPPAGTGRQDGLRAPLPTLPPVPQARVR
jgi:hypothetical protein